MATRLSDYVNILWPLNVAAVLLPFGVQCLTPPVIANGADVPVNRYRLAWSEAIPGDGARYIDQPQRPFFHCHALERVDE